MSKKCPQGNIFHKTDPPQQFHWLRIILGKLVTRPTHRTNQDATLFFCFWCFFAFWRALCRAAQHLRDLIGCCDNRSSKAISSLLGSQAIGLQKPIQGLTADISDFPRVSATCCARHCAVPGSILHQSVVALARQMAWHGSREGGRSSEVKGQTWYQD